MSTITLRSVKGSGLTNNEIDANFTNLNTDKIEATQTVTLTNKTLALGSNTISGTLAQFNTALSDGDFATLAGTETLTNKTLTAPVLANPSYSGATANGGTVTTIDINGGTIDGTVIGGSSAAAGSFTTVSASGSITSGASGGSDGSVVLKRASDGLTVGTLSADSANSQLDVTTAYAAIQFNTYAGQKALINDTGLAVTGALSATGTATTVFGTSMSAGQTFGPAGTGGGVFINTPSLSANYNSGLAIDGSYAGGTVPSTINLKALGIYSGGGYASNLAFWTSAGITASEKMRLDYAGNLGIGVTPTTAAVGVAKSLHIGDYTVFGQKSDGAFHCGHNYYEYTSGGYKYSSSFYATKYEQQSGQHRWYIAPSGTAGNVITFTEAMMLDASGNLGLGVTPNGTEKALIFPDTLSIKVSLNGQVTGNYYAIEKRAAVSGGDGAFKFVAGNTVAGEFVFSSGGSNKAVLDASGNLTVTGGITTGSYTVATRPAHAAGRIIHVTDGGAGAVFQGSAGGAWVNLG